MISCNPILDSKRVKWPTLLCWFACFFFMIISTAYLPKEKSPERNTATNEGTRLVTLRSDEFQSFVNKVYRQLEYSFTFDTIPNEVLTHALRGYTYLKHTQQLTNTKYLTVIDFSQHCNKRRLWVIDLKTKKVVLNEWVAHGDKSGDTYAMHFSNQHNSNKSSLGFYTTGGLYSGSNDLSLKLHGLEKDFNTNAFARGIVIHGASYVNENRVNSTERIGRSFGCPAVRKTVNQKLISTIKDGSCLFIWHPSPSYLKSSIMLNTNLSLTLDDLNS